MKLKNLYSKVQSLTDKVEEAELICNLDPTKEKIAIYYKLVKELFNTYTEIKELTKN